MFYACEQTHLQTLASSNGLEFRGREKEADEHRHIKLPSAVTQRLRQPGGKIWASYGSRVERCRDLRVCLWGVGWFWVCVFMPPHYQLLTLAKRQGVCNMAQAWLYPRHGNPCGLRRRPGAHIGSICWLGDKFLLVRWEEASSIMLFSFAAWAAEERVWWGHAAARPCKHLSDKGEAMSERDTLTWPWHLANFFSPAITCLQLQTPAGNVMVRFIHFL